MVITITCPSCSSTFPVDPAKIPAGGVNARCTQCGDVFRVEEPAEAAPEPIMDLPEPVMAEPPPLPEMPAAPELPGLPEMPEMPEVPAAPEMDEPALELPEGPTLEPTPEFAAPTGGADPFAQTAPFEEPTLAAPEVPAEAPVAEAPVVEEPKVQGFTFGKRDPTDKAKRLARVLVSDMIMYNAERHQNALAAGTLVEDFEDEIDKSWKEYVEQVGEEMANGEGRQFWTDALNDILAKGQEVF